MAPLGKTLNVDHHFAVANLAWANGTLKLYNWELICTAKAMLSETGCAAGEWVQLVPVAEWALNSAYRQRIWSTPF